MSTISFKQYHDENGIFHKEVKLNFGQCNKNGKILLSQLLLLTSDSGVEDYHQQGCTWQLLRDNNIFILMSRVSLHILKMPVTNQLITIDTWEEKPDAVQLNRRYRLVDTETNELLVYATSSWMVVNAETRRIIPSRHFTLRPGSTIETEFDGLPLGKIPVPENLTLLDKRVIRFSDVDANGHTNNSRYGDFIMDALPEDLQNYNYKDIRLNYSHEAVLGETLFIYYSINDNEVIVIGKQDENTCFEAILYK